MSNVHVDTESSTYKELLVAARELEATGYELPKPTILPKLQAEKLEVFNRLLERFRKESIVHAGE